MEAAATVTERSCVAMAPAAVAVAVGAVGDLTYDGPVTAGDLPTLPERHDLRARSARGAVSTSSGGPRA